MLPEDYPLLEEIHIDRSQKISPKSLLPREVLLYLLDFLDVIDAINFEVSLGSQRKNSKEKSLLEEFAGEQVGQLKFQALAHAAPDLLKKLNEKIENERSILKQHN